MSRSLHISQNGCAETEVLYDSRTVADLNDVTDAELALSNYEGSGNDIFDQTLCTKAYCQAHDPSACENRADLEVQLSKHH
jgi:hypothetical protein